MVQIIVDIDEEIDRQVKLYTTMNCLAAKSMAIEQILIDYFKKNKIEVNTKKEK